MPLRELPDYFVPNESQIKELQNQIIKSIKEELVKDKIGPPSSWRDSVWFCPDLCEFLYNDRFVFHQVVKPLIIEKVLIPVSYRKHQGVKSVRYMLNKDVV